MKTIITMVIMSLSLSAAAKCNKALNQDITLHSKTSVVKVDTKEIKVDKNTEKRDGKY